MWPNGQTLYPLYSPCCIYHYGKMIQVNNRAILTCCRNTVDAHGCKCSSYHVHNDNVIEGALFEFCPTTQGEYSVPYRITRVIWPGEGLNVAALNCEMVFTTGGLELARTTIAGSYKSENAHKKELCSKEHDHTYTFISPGPLSPESDPPAPSLFPLPRTHIVSRWKSPPPPLVRIHDF